MYLDPVGQPLKRLFRYGFEYSDCWVDDARLVVLNAIDAAARGAVLLLVALVITTLLHRRSAAARHAVWVGAIAGQLVLLGLAMWGPRWRIEAPAPIRRSGSIRRARRGDDRSDAAHHPRREEGRP